MANVQEIFNKIKERQKEQKTLRQIYRDVVANSQEYQNILEEYILDDFNSNDNNIIANELEKRLFGYKNIDLEIGSGNGKFIVELAINNKDKYFLGIEYSFKAAKKTVEKAYKRNIKNLTIIFGEANSVIEKYFNKKYSFDNIYLNFPDPWPKKRHSHRRIFNKEFLNKIYSILKDNGIFYSATDDDNYALKIMNPIYKESEIFKNILEKESSKGRSTSYRIKK